MHVYRVYEQEYLNSESLESLNSDARVFSKNKNFISHGKSFFINFKLIENLNIILRNLHGACLSRVISAIMSLHLFILCAPITRNTIAVDVSAKSAFADLELS